MFDLYLKLPQICNKLIFDPYRIYNIVDDEILDEAESLLDPKSERVQEFVPNSNLNFNNTSNDVVVVTTNNPFNDVTTNKPFNVVTTNTPLNEFTVNMNYKEVTNQNILTDSQVNRCDCGTGEQIVKSQKMLCRNN